MMKTADADGRFELSYREYRALSALFGCKNALLQNAGEIEKRVRTIPGGYRDMKMVMSVMDKLVQNVLKTIPTERLIAIREELNRTYCELKVATPMSKLPEGAVYVPEKNLESLVEHAIDWHCLGCDKTHKEAKRKCALYADIQSCYHYEFEKCEKCPFSDTEVE